MKGGTMSVRDLMFAIAFALAATSAAAQSNLEKLDKAYREGACSNDLKSYCARVKPGDARIADCLAQNFRRIEPACRGLITAARNKFDAMAAACKGDAEKLCKGVPYREGRVLSCLKNREASLSSACAVEFKRIGGDQAVTQ
jgi:cysteine rich repeat protein